MAAIKFPMTIKQLKKSLDSDKLRRYGVHIKMLEDQTESHGTIIVKWSHSDFVFIKMVITATRERVTGDIHDTLVFDLEKVLDITVSGMKGNTDGNIENLDINEIKAPVNDMLKVWNNLHVTLHRLTHRINPHATNRTYLAIKL